MKYLPAIARRLHHCRDLGESEPFDFLTLFEYAEADAASFDDLVAALRETEEWKFVEREVDLRLVRIGPDRRSPGAEKVLLLSVGAFMRSVGVVEMIVRLAVPAISIDSAGAEA